jgi:hypothetical protein
MRYPGPFGIFTEHEFHAIFSKIMEEEGTLPSSFYVAIFTSGTKVGKYFIKGVKKTIHQYFS